MALQKGIKNSKTGSESPVADELIITYIAHFHLYPLKHLCLIDFTQN